MKRQVRRTGQSPRKQPAGRFRLISPVTGSVLDRVALKDSAGIQAALARLDCESPGPGTSSVFAFLDRLRCRMELRKGDLVERTLLETGFILEDCHEIIQGTIDYLRDFRSYTAAIDIPAATHRWDYSAPERRHHQVAIRPVRCVAGIVPQNASIPLAVIMIASALYAGACVAIRPSLQCGSTGVMLDDLIRESDPPDRRILVLNCLATDFLDACYASDRVDLIHYIGSSRYVREIMLRSFETRKMCLIDGQGNGLLYVDESFPVEEAASLITRGATRYNGATCTSVNGVLAAHPIHRSLVEAVVESMKRIKVGDPRHRSTGVGPLFNRDLARGLRAALDEAGHCRVLCGGTARHGLFTPAVLEGAEPGDRIVQEGFMGPALWIRGVRGAEAETWIRANRFPLSDTILSHRPEKVERFAVVSRAARICVNVDPSVESMFEPWGGYPPSGLNPVCTWIDKYRQAYQLDCRSQSGPDAAVGDAA